ncbi:MAG: hypothetical protein M1284_03300 [Candidatus Parvarchaeota archaeon]|jgi:hypothetical protein|nr:hypothetical protein [Candidatus Parvarchaeota archaeon]MCL5420749.1 hypothetical protein [Candidatus Parvarchaeota archaeon]
MGFAGTNISNADAEEILTSLVKAYSVIPPAMKPYIPPLDRILKVLPDSVRKYSVEDIVKLLDWAAKNEIVI